MLNSCAPSWTSSARRPDGLPVGGQLHSGGHSDDWLFTTTAKLRPSLGSGHRCVLVLVCAAGEVLQWFVSQSCCHCLHCLHPLFLLLCVAHGRRQVPPYHVTADNEVSALPVLSAHPTICQLPWQACRTFKLAERSHIRCGHVSALQQRSAATKGVWLS